MITDKVIGNYRITGILGEGGMGIVYKAFDFKLERFVALKILNPHALNNLQFVERFKREAKHQAGLNHPNIVPVYGFVEERNLLGIVMEYVEGETLDNYIIRSGQLQLKESLLIMKQVLEGAGFAHKKGYVHRDFKPSNIIINSGGIVKIMDFGISKSLTEAKGITKTGVKIGTILYMSPEQIKAQELTNQSDIYSLGITLYEMLTGKTPFDSDTEYGIMEAHLKNDPPKISSYNSAVPHEADEIIGKALSKTLQKRYLSCEDFLFDIDSLLKKLESNEDKKRIKEAKIKAVTSETPALQEGKSSGRSRLSFYIYAFLFIVIAGFIAVVSYSAISKIFNGRNTHGKVLKFNSAWDVYHTSSPFNLNGLTLSGDSTVFACGDSGTVIYNSNSGSGWNIAAVPVKDNLFDIKFTPNGKGFAAGEKGIILASDDGGKTWRKLSSPLSVSLFKIFFVDGKKGFITGSEGTLLKTEDGGKSWVMVSLPVKETLYDIAFYDKMNGCVSGWNGTILVTTNGGSNWEKKEKFTDNYLRSVAPAGKDIWFAGGGGGELFKSGDNGNSWGSVKIPPASSLCRINFPAKGNGIITGTKGEISLSTDGGDNWRKQKPVVYSSLNNVLLLKNKIFIAGNNGIILSAPVSLIDFP